MNRREAIKRTALVTGIAVASNVSFVLLESCHPKYESNWLPVFLTKEEVDLISAISESILPKSDTPGANDLHLFEFIDLMLKDTITESQQVDFRKELETFSASVMEKYSKKLQKCSLEEKIETIKDLDAKSYQQRSETGKNSFYLTIKELTILGFFTSEYVMKNLMDYHPIPGDFIGCIDVGTDAKLAISN